MELLIIIGFIAFISIYGIFHDCRDNDNIGDGVKRKKT